VELWAERDRRIGQLSGGQQQRVALARALAVDPSVLLFDEPLSNLDARLREDMRLEILELQRSMGFTAIYVTHDQQEAFSLSSRIAVMSKGRIEQLGTPWEVWQRPASAFVADFVGSTNHLTGRVEATADGGAALRLRDGTTLKLGARPDLAADSDVDAYIKIGSIKVYGTEPPDRDNCWKVRVNLQSFHGEWTLLKVALGQEQLSCRWVDTGPRVFDYVYVRVDPADILCYRVA
jgi:ABC-type Fe3+/spermidine/putrescine transport system ATPase subunit